MDDSDEEVFIKLQGCSRGRTVSICDAITVSNCNIEDCSDSSSSYEFPDMAFIQQTSTANNYSSITRMENITHTSNEDCETTSEVKKIEQTIVDLNKRKPLSQISLQIAKKTKIDYINEDKGCKRVVIDVSNIKIHKKLEKSSCNETPKNNSLFDLLDDNLEDNMASSTYPSHTAGDDDLIDLENFSEDEENNKVMTNIAKTSLSSVRKGERSNINPERLLENGNKNVYSVDITSQISKNIGKPQDTDFENSPPAANQTEAVIYIEHRLSKINNSEILELGPKQDTTPNIPVSVISEPILIQSKSTEISEPIQIQSKSTEISEPIQIQSTSAEISKPRQVQSTSSKISDPKRNATILKSYSNLKTSSEDQKKNRAYFPTRNTKSKLSSMVEDEFKLLQEKKKDVSTSRNSIIRSENTSKTKHNRTASQTSFKVPSKSGLSNEKVKSTPNKTSKELSGKVSKCTGTSENYSSKESQNIMEFPIVLYDNHGKTFVSTLSPSSSKAKEVNKEKPFCIACNRVTSNRHKCSKVPDKRKDNNNETKKQSSLSRKEEPTYKRKDEIIHKNKKKFDHSKGNKSNDAADVRKLKSTNSESKENSQNLNTSSRLSNSDKIKQKLGLPIKRNSENAKKSNINSTALTDDSPVDIDLIINLLESIYDCKTYLDFFAPSIRTLISKAKGCKVEKKSFNKVLKEKSTFSVLKVCQFLLKKHNNESINKNQKRQIERSTVSISNLMEIRLRISMKKFDIQMLAGETVGMNPNALSYFLKAFMGYQGLPDLELGDFVHLCHQVMNLHKSPMGEQNSRQDSSSNPSTSSAYNCNRFQANVRSKSDSKEQSNVDNGHESIKPTLGSSISSDCRNSTDNYPENGTIDRDQVEKLAENFLEFGEDIQSAIRGYLQELLLTEEYRSYAENLLNLINYKVGNGQS